ncbi:hypothetical protein [Crenothrix sp.]|uniref:hypothetical protein n=1 Tax=Crenothrix sp. TaxID=3100433 RepID=UPI00374D3CD2
MARFHKKFSYVKVTETWFTYKFNFRDLFTLNAYLHIKDAENQKIFGIQDNSCTVELKLDSDIETIFANFRPTLRRDIKNSQKELVECHFRDDKIDEFVSFHNAFANSKKIWLTSKSRIEEMGDNIKMSFATLNGQTLAVHSYLVDEEVGIARLLHSASNRLDENIDKNLTGRAGKLLTYKDIIFFKEAGYKIMDFGGYADNTEDKSLKGINEFKLSFGGEKVTCVNYYSIPHYVLKKIREKISSV